MFNLAAKASCTIICFGIATLIAGVHGGTVFAAPGDLDATFGGDGIVTTPIPNQSIGAASGIVIQPDGRSVVTVLAHSISGGFDLAVVRYNIDGTLDTTFSGDGIFNSPFDADDSDIASGLALQSDGKILIVGTVVDDAAGGFFILRINSDGSLDTSFGLGGIMRTGVNGASNGVSIAVQTDGKILAAGTAFSPTNEDFFLVLRLNSNGSLDTSFGNNGSARVSFGIVDFFEAMELQTDGRIILMGNGDLSSSNPYVAIARFTSNGTLDPTFGGDGTVTTQGISLGGTSMALQTDGKLLMGGESQGDFAVLRLNTNGSFDTGFDDDGLAITSFGPTSDMVNDLAVLPDNKIVAVGETAIGTTLSDLDVAIARFNSNGSVDTTFGTSGKVVTRLGAGSDLMNAVAIQADGKILAAGAGTATGSSQLTAIRYLSQGHRTRFDFDGDGRADISVFRPDGSNPSVWYFLNSSNGFSASQFGLGTDIVVPDDYDGDGRSDMAVFRSGVWYILNSSNGIVRVEFFGLSSDEPVQNDYDGDGKSDPAVYRDGTWHVLGSSSGYSATQFGIATDRTVGGDYDGDGKADRAIYRDGEWHVLGSLAGYYVVPFGIASDRPVPADFDGDRRIDQAVYRDGIWYVLGSSTGVSILPSGIASDQPVPADYDGDGKSDRAVYRNGVWYVLNSSSGVTVTGFGLANDIPLPFSVLP